MTKIERILESDGVISVHAVDAATSRVLRGGPTDHDGVLATACALLPRLGKPSMRVFLTKRTIVVERVGSWTVACVMVTGHAVAKSLPRLIRRLFSAEKRAHGPRPRARRSKRAETRMPAVRLPVAVPPVTNDEPDTAVRGIYFDPAGDSEDGGLPFSPKRRLTQRDEYEAWE